MKKQVAFKTVLCGMALYSALLFGEQAMADDKVVAPKGSDKPIFTVGTGNLFVGESAGNHTLTGGQNTGVGYEDLSHLTDGNVNAALGYSALKSTTTGYCNTGIGVCALVNSTTGRFNTATGSSALFNNTDGRWNTATGHNSLASNTTGQLNIGYGRDAGVTNTTGNSNTFVGNEADAVSSNLSNATAIGNGAKVAASNRVRIGNDAVTHIQGKVDFTTTSDKRKKKDIQDITRGLAFIKALHPVEYRMIRKEGEDRLNFGFIAQDIEALLGDKYNILDIGPDKDRSLSLRYTDFLAPMVKTMQEQQKLIIAMRAEMDQLKAEMAAIKAGK
jgi:trimeric autotransporter adhesin